MKTNTKHWASITAGILSLAGYASAASLGSEKYTYDASGNIIEKQIGVNVTRFGYEQNILKNNNRGNIYLVDEAGRQSGEAINNLSASKLAYQYGDKVTQVVKRNGTKTNFFYNSEGQLVAVVAVNSVETFAWDGLALAKRGEQVFTNEDNLVGSVPALTGDKVTVSNPQGTTLSIGEKNFEASAFGEGLEEGFLTGKPFVQELDGFVFKHRNYSPFTARWATPDPSGFPDGKNQYLFVKCDPVNWYDRQGLEAETPDYLIASATSREDNNNSNSLTPELTRSIGVQVFSKFHHLREEVGAVYFEAEPESGSAGFEYTPPTAVFDAIPIEESTRIKDNKNWTRFNPTIKAYTVAYVVDEHKRPIAGSELNLDGTKQDFTTWLPEN